MNLLHSRYASKSVLLVQREQVSPSFELLVCCFGRPIDIQYTGTGFYQDSQNDKIWAPIVEGLIHAAVSEP